MRFKSRSDKLSAPVISQRHGKWLPEEHERMFAFLKDHRDDLVDYLEVNLEGSVKRNKRQFFTKMAAFIKTKTDKQCKSRYQKQELALLRALDIPQDLLASFQQKRSKESVPRPKKKRASLQTTEEDANSIKSPVVEKSAISIHTYDDLKTTLSVNFLPRIQNDVIRLQMERFLRGLSNESEGSDDLPSLNMNSLSIILPQFGLSFGNFKDRDSSFLDEYT